MGDILQAFLARNKLKPSHNHISLKSYFEIIFINYWSSFKKEITSLLINFFKKHQLPVIERHILQQAVILSYILLPCFC